jgi:hypothetical protein
MSEWVYEEESETAPASTEMSTAVQTEALNLVSLYQDPDPAELESHEDLNPFANVLSEGQ